jgi:hypothetical protein
MPRIDFARAISAEARSEASAATLRERIRQCRDRAMNAGVMVGGIVMQTDDRSQQRLLGAVVAAMRNPALVVNWKTDDGTCVPLDAETLLAAADAIRAHVQVCFDREAELLTALSGGEDVDPEEGWPA